jgi:hypothetical protein
LRVLGPKREKSSWRLKKTAEGGSSQSVGLEKYYVVASKCSQSHFISDKYNTII